MLSINNRSNNNQSSMRDCFNIDNVSSFALNNINPSPPSYQAAMEEALINETKSYSNISVDLPLKYDDREEKYRKIIRKHEINLDFANRLQQLQGFKVVFIFDDSGSMNTVLQDSPLNTSDNLIKATRWDELRCFANISIEIASVFDPNGSDIYFLNRSPSPVKNVREPADLTAHFHLRPNGFTPLAKVLERVLTDNPAVSLSEKRLLIIIATDGEPTDDTGKVAIKNFKRILKSRSSKVFTTIVVCTDDDESVKYLNRWDRKLPNLDVVDDFRNERQEIRRVKGSSFPFSFGDYVVKSLIGSIDAELDQMDETSCCMSF